MSLAQARLLLEELKAQDKRYVYAARKGICAGADMGKGMTEMFRVVDGRVRHETINSKSRAGKDRKYFDLPPQLESEVREFLNSL